MKERNAYGVGATELRMRWHHMDAKRGAFADIIKWCNEYAGNGDFIRSPQTASWYFENENDAMMFALIWG